jgi:hypothetical protein
MSGSAVKRRRGKGGRGRRAKGCPNKIYLIFSKSSDGFEVQEENGAASYA